MVCLSAFDCVVAAVCIFTSTCVVYCYGDVVLDPLVCVLFFCFYVQN